MSLKTMFGTLAAPLLLHHNNQVRAINRAAAAKEMGLDPQNFGTPYPGSTVTNNTTTTAAPASILGQVLTWVLAPTLGAGLLTAGALGLNYLLKSAPPVAAPAIVAPANPNPAPKDPGIQAPDPGPSKKFKAVYRQQQPDGSWKVIKTESLNTQ